MKRYNIYADDANGDKLAIIDSDNGKWVKAQEAVDFLYLLRDSISELSDNDFDPKSELEFIVNLLEDKLGELDEKA